MHRCDIRKAFRRLKHKKCVGCAALLLGGFGTPHTHIYEDISVGGVLLSHNPTIAVPSAQSSLATGIGTGPGVPSTLKPPTQTQFETNHPKRVCCVKHCTTNTNTILFSFLRQPHALGAINCSFFIAHTHKKHSRCVILCRCISTSHLQHVTMLTALAYQPHHLQGTSTETSSQNRLPA